MSGWRIIVNWFLPPPLILTCLLILPMPVIVKKGLLIFTKHFLFAELAGPLRLVHIALTITGVAFAGSAMQTWQLTQTPLPEALTPNQRTALLARRWREERNFWIALLTFMLWGLLFRFYQLMLEHMALKDRVKQLEQGALAARSALGSAAATAGAGAGAGAAAKHGAGGKGAGGGKAADAEPSAPPEPVSVELKKLK